MSIEVCHVCGDSGEDRRTLRIDYGVNMLEVSPKFERSRIGGVPDAGKHLLRTCKDCRADLLSVIAQWAAGDLYREVVYTERRRRNVPVRFPDGSIRMMSDDEADMLKEGMKS